MEFIPRSAPAPSVEARRRHLREVGVAAVAAALGIAEGAPAHAPNISPTDPRMALPQRAA